MGFRKALRCALMANGANTLLSTLYLSMYACIRRALSDTKVAPLLPSFSQSDAVASARVVTLLRRVGHALCAAHHDQVVRAALDRHHAPAHRGAARAARCFDRRGFDAGAGPRSARPGHPSAAAPRGCRSACCRGRAPWGPRGVLCWIAARTARAPSSRTSSVALLAHRSLADASDEHVPHVTPPRVDPFYKSTRKPYMFRVADGVRFAQVKLRPAARRCSQHHLCRPLLPCTRRNPKSLLVNK